MIDPLLSPFTHSHPSILPAFQPSTVYAGAFRNTSSNVVSPSSARRTPSA